MGFWDWLKGPQVLEMVAQPPKKFGGVTLVDGRKHGRWLEPGHKGGWYELHYKRGGRHGAWVERYPDGKIATLANYVLDLLEGDYETRWENGELKTRGTCVGGKRQGTWKKWGPTGALEVQFEMADDKWHGPAVFHFVGRTTHGQYDRGKRTGEWVERDKAGEVIARETFQDDKSVVRTHVKPIVYDRGPTISLEELAKPEAPSPARVNDVAFANAKPSPDATELHLACDFTADQLRQVVAWCPEVETLELAVFSCAEGIEALAFPKLRALTIEESGALGPLLAWLARAPWARGIETLALLDLHDDISDAQLGALLANLPALRGVTLWNAELGAASARALTDRPISELFADSCAVTAEGLAGLAALPALRSLTLTSCRLPALTIAQARALHSSTLRELDLSGSFEVEQIHGGMQRLAVVPALAGVVELDLAANSLDRLSARLLARSNYLREIRQLRWSGNDTNSKDLAELRAVLHKRALRTG